MPSSQTSRLSSAKKKTTQQTTSQRDIDVQLTCAPRRSLTSTQLTLSTPGASPSIRTTSVPISEATNVRTSPPTSMTTIEPASVMTRESASVPSATTSEPTSVMRSGRTSLTTSEPMSGTTSQSTSVILAASMRTGMRTAHSGTSAGTPKNLAANDSAHIVNSVSASRALDAHATLHEGTSKPDGPTSIAEPENEVNNALVSDSLDMSTLLDMVAQWTKKFFVIPNNSVGKAFIDELASQLQAYVDSAGMNADALNNFIVLPSLILQRPTAGCGYKETTQHMRRRLALWADRNLSELLKEGQSLQKQFRTRTPGGHFRGEKDRAQKFGNCMSAGRIPEALRMLTEGQPEEDTRSGVLHISEMITLKDGSVVSVREQLREKHPPAQRASPEVLIDGSAPAADTIRFEALTSSFMQRVALQSKGSAGPSGLDSNTWRRMCSSFKGTSSRLCQSLANFARMLATRHVDSATLAPFLACRLIALDKKPGVRPIGVCDVARRIIFRAILMIVRDDVEETCGFLQKCSGFPAGLEAAVHAMQDIYDEESTEGILFVDAKNAFNSMNREAALHNVQFLCPDLAMSIRNCYQAPSKLFVSGGGELMSEEGTTQGDPLSMPFYALATLPLVRRLQNMHESVRQVWMADDSAGAGRLRALRQWWDALSEEGKSFGYYTNDRKTILLVKTGMQTLAKEIFHGTDVHITSGGVGYLGSAVGDASYVKTAFQHKVEQWQSELEQLSKFARTEPHTALAALTHGLRSRFTFVLRTMPSTEESLAVLDQVLEKQFLPALTGKLSFTSDELTLLRLPARLGGIGLPWFSRMATTELKASREMTQAQVKEILLQNVDHHVPGFASVHKAAVKARNVTKTRRRKEEESSLKCLKEGSSMDVRRLDLLSAKGTSAWLTTLPLKMHGFLLSKRDFRDALALRYDWQLESVPLKCACGADFSADHAMVCALGGYPTIRHNELRDLIGSLLTEVCHNVCVEPLLQPLSGETFRSRTTNTSEEARADVRATGFWTRCEEAFFDIRVFHPNAASYKTTSPEDLFRQHERQKKLEYEERIVNIDRGSFCPLVFSTTGATGAICDRFLRKLAAKLSDSDDAKYSSTMAWLRCRVSFALLRNAVMCIRGTRSSQRRALQHERSLAIAESRLGAMT